MLSPTEFVVLKEGLDIVVKIDYNNVKMDIFKLLKSKTRQKLLKIFLDNPGQDFYLRELERTISLSVGNIRRELNGLVSLGLFTKYKKGKAVYYRLNKNSDWHNLILSLSKKQDLLKSGFNWAYSLKPVFIAADWHCPTRDVFQTRLETMIFNLEQELKNKVFLLGAIAGEIGNNSFDHNLGRWQDTPGIFFAIDKKKKIIVLADRGVGVLKTIKNVLPKVKDDSEALKLAFTKIISGRKGEHRGNGLKFVAKVLKDQKWRLEFYSGTAQALLPDLLIKKARKHLRGCLAVIKFSDENVFPCFNSPSQ